MIAVSTGELKIHQKEKEYTLLSKNIADLMESLEEEGVYIENPNKFKSLSDWRDRWSSLERGYASKAGYIHDLYTTSFNQIDIVLCQRYVKGKSHQQLVEEWQISQFENLITKIKKLKGIMISVAIQGESVYLIKSEEENYRKLYRFSKSQVQKAWVRFGYKNGSYESEKDILKLDFISNSSHLDYAFLKINAQTQQKSIFINETYILDSGQDIRIIHHPQGNPVIISDLGQITQVGEDYIDHNLKTDNGSSGAPIFNRQWELIAIHQGNPGIGRTVTPGSTGGIPIRTIWNQISPHLA
ncbi:MAG: serine protease [Nostoc sp.]|uniref:trypsin-like serine peptidase n=1 Tax=Nostoc sp. TaxID=1180 RepID=UPI002FF50224